MPLSVTFEKKLSNTDKLLIFLLLSVSMIVLLDFLNVTLRSGF